MLPHCMAAGSHEAGSESSQALQAWSKNWPASLLTYSIGQLVTDPRFRGQSPISRLEECQRIWKLCFNITTQIHSLSINPIVLSKTQSIFKFVPIMSFATIFCKSGIQSRYALHVVVVVLECPRTLPMQIVFYNITIFEESSCLIEHPKIHICLMVSSRLESGENIFDKSICDRGGHILPAAHLGRPFVPSLVMLSGITWLRWRPPDSSR